MLHQKTLAIGVTLVTSHLGVNHSFFLDEDFFEAFFFGAGAAFFAGLMSLR